MHDASIVFFLSLNVHNLMFKRTFFLVMLCFLLLLLFFFALACWHAQTVKRDPMVLLHKYYVLRDKRPKHARKFLRMILAQQPDHLIALRELSHWYVSHEDLAHALPLIRQLQALEQNTSRMLWHDFIESIDFITYFERMLPTFFLAFHHLKYHALSFLRVKSVVGLAQVPGPVRVDAHPVQARIPSVMQKEVVLPVARITSTPFREIFVTPLTQSRFGLTIGHLIARYGLEQNNRWHSMEYVFDRITKDNKSRNLGLVTQLYEDNVQLLGVGMQWRPLPRMPMHAFLETAAAYDLIYQNRPRWRGDLRAGLMLYDERGTATDYRQTISMLPHYMATYYANGTYFTRYSNFIAEFRSNQGLRVMQWHYTTLDVYLTGRVVADGLRLFFNNYVELGPGFIWTPYALHHVKLRADVVRGHYLPAGRSFNPFAPYYNNVLVQFIWYGKY